MSLLSYLLFIHMSGESILKDGLEYMTEVKVEGKKLNYVTLSV